MLQIHLESMQTKGLGGVFRGDEHAGLALGPRPERDGQYALHRTSEAFESRSPRATEKRGRDSSDTPNQPLPLLSGISDSGRSSQRSTASSSSGVPNEKSDWKSRMFGR